MYYSRFKIIDVPDEFINEYDLNDFAHNNRVYFEITKADYGLKQASKLANDLHQE